MDVQVVYFALPNELRLALRRAEDELPIHYVRSGLFDSNNITNYQTLLHLDTLGQNAKGDINFGDSFLVLPRCTEPVVETVPQRRGGIKYAIGQSRNPQSVHLVLPGTFGDIAVIGGRLGTINVQSKDLYAALRKQLLKGFESIKGWYLSPEAREWLNRGKRITTSIKSPPEYDLAV